jgi:hypothetical protein
MSKSKNTKYFHDEEEISPSKYNEDKKNKRKQKRILAAIKSKNISKLIEYEDDYE